MKKTTLFLVVVLAFCITATTEAAVTVFNNEADYDAATGSQIFLINFDGNPSGGTLAAGNSFSAAVTFGSPEASDPTQVWWNSDAISDAGSTTAPNGVGPMDGIFTDPVYAFALVFLSSGENETVYLYDESDALIGAVVAPNPTGFFGVLSDTPIKSFFIDNGEFWKVPEEEYWPDRFFIDDFRANELLIQVNIDIKPGSCPNPLNPKSKGIVPVAIVGTGEFDPTTEVVPESTTLEGVPVLKWEILDSTQPDDYDPTDCSDCFNAEENLNCDLDGDGINDAYCGDGIPDMILYFDTQELVEVIGHAVKGDCLELILRGELIGGEEFGGSDSMVILKNIDGDGI